MKTLVIGLVAVCLLAPGTVLAEGEGPKDMAVTAYSLSAGEPAPDPAGGSCAPFLENLMVRGFVLESAASVQGPPGVVYTLIKDKKGHARLAIVKCGMQGGECGGEEGSAP